MSACESAPAKGAGEVRASCGPSGRGTDLSCCIPDCELDFLPFHVDGFYLLALRSMRTCHCDDSAGSLPVRDWRRGLKTLKSTPIVAGWSCANESSVKRNRMLDFPTPLSIQQTLRAINQRHSVMYISATLLHIEVFHILQPISKICLTRPERLVKIFT